MSVKHPIIAVTGSSGAGTTTVKRAFEAIFERERVNAVVIEGDSFHRYDRAAMKAEMARQSEAGNHFFSHFGPEANLFEKLEETFRTYGETGTCERRYYLHSPEEAAEHNARLGTNLEPGQFTPWEKMPPGSDLLFYEGLHGLVKDEEGGRYDVARHVDLGVGVVPIVNLEWIQKIFRDNAERGYSAKEIVDTILRRMPDYVNHITPQFSRTDINFQRVPTVDTSNPFIARDIPQAHESLVVIRFANPAKFDIDFPYLLSMLHQSFMTRRNTIVIPAGKMQMAMEIIFEPIIRKLLRDRAAAGVRQAINS